MRWAWVQEEQQSRKLKTLQGCVCGMIPAPASPRVAPSQLGWARVIPETCRRRCNDSRKPAKTARSSKQPHKSQPPAPLEAQPQASPTALRRARGSQSGASHTLGACPASAQRPASPQRRKVCSRMRTREEPQGTPGAGGDCGSRALSIVRAVRPW